MPKNVKNKKAKEPKISFLAKLEAGQERTHFFENFSLLIGSGMDVLVALDSALAETRTKSMRMIVGQVKEKINNGEPVWRAFESTGFLASHVISLIRIGEEAGRLPENLAVISVQQQKENTFRSKLFSAMLYPAITLSLTLIVGILIAWFILPRLAIVFDQLNITLPLITKLVIGFGRFLSDYGIIAVPVAIILVVSGFYLLFANPKTRIYGEKLIGIVPGAQRIIREIEVARLGYILGTLLEAGLPVLDALRSIRDATPFITYQRFYDQIFHHIEQGDSFRSSFKGIKKIDRLLPVPIQQLISSSEQSGNLAKSLLEIGRRYEDRIDNTSKNLVVILEPVLLVVVWVGVVTVAVAVILPIYSLVGQFNGSSAVNPNPQQDVGAIESSSQQVTGDAGQVAGATTNLGWIVTIEAVVPVEVVDRPAEAGQVIATAFPADSYFSQEMSGGWYKIKLPSGQVGWIDFDSVSAVSLDE